MATEGGAGELTSQVLYAIGSGRTKFNEIRDAVKTDPSRTLDRLREVRLVERFMPVTEDEQATRRRLYQIADNFLAFWLRTVSRHRSEIEREMGQSIIPTVLKELDDHMGAVGRKRSGRTFGASRSMDNSAKRLWRSARTGLPSRPARLANPAARMKSTPSRSRVVAVRRCS